MKFGAKLLLCAVIPALLFVTGLVASTGGLTHAVSRFSGYIETEQRIVAGLKEMYAQGLQMGQAMRNIVLDPANPRAFDNLEAARKAYEKADKETGSVVESTPFAKGLETLRSLRATHASAQDGVLAKARSRADDTVKTLNSTETPAWRELRAELLKQIEAADQTSKQTQAGIEAEVRRLTTLAVALAALAVGVSAVLTIYLRRTVARELGGGRHLGGCSAHRRRVSTARRRASFGWRETARVGVPTGSRVEKPPG